MAVPTTVRRWLAIGCIAVVVAAVGVYLVRNAPPAPTTTGVASLAAGEVLVVDQSTPTSDVVGVEPDDPEASRTPTGLRCQRVYRAAGMTSCMRISGPGPTYELEVLDRAGQVVRTVPVPGIPSRTRVSASGRMVSWTVFVTGDSYAVPGSFSTRTGVLDLATGRVTESLETFAAELDGRPHSAIDINYWGVTVAADDRTFYATMATGNRFLLARGDLETGRIAALREDAECPSLSPDGSRIAYKKRTGRLGGWQLAVLEVGSGREILLPGTEGLDDQAMWSDDSTLLYGAPADSGRPPAVYRTRADGSGAPELVAAAASSPSPAA